jgi:hypothetical protein
VAGAHTGKRTPRSIRTRLESPLLASDGASTMHNKRALGRRPALSTAPPTSGHTMAQSRTSGQYSKHLANKKTMRPRPWRTWTGISRISSASILALAHQQIIASVAFLPGSAFPFPPPPNPAPPRRRAKRGKFRG